MIDQTKLFNKLSSLLGSKYAATMYLAKKARTKQEELKFLITESEALTWALTHKLPPSFNIRISTKSRKLKDIEDILNYVEDDEVQTAARHSFRLSVKCSHLIYVYIKVTDESRQSRVRILTRIMFYKYKEENKDA